MVRTGRCTVQVGSINRQGAGTAHWYQVHAHWGPVLTGSRKQIPGAAEDGKEHGPGEPARIGVLQRRMVAAEQSASIRKPVFSAMREGHLLCATCCASHVSPIAIPGDSAQADHYLQSGQQSDFFIDPGRAVALFPGRRLVVGRSTPDYRGDPRIVQYEAITAGN